MFCLTIQKKSKEEDHKKEEENKHKKDVEQLHKQQEFIQNESFLAI